MKKEMSILEFELLSRGRKLHHLWENCVYIMPRFEHDYRIHLYACSNFYIEVWYKYGINTIKEIASFKSMKGLNPYLDKIDISHCFQKY